MAENRTQPTNRGQLIPQKVTMYLNDSSVAFHGWESLEVQENIDTIANPFSFEIPQTFQQRGEAFTLSPGTKVAVFVNDEPVITGRVERTEVTISARRKVVKVSGRSLTGDLVDCTHEGAMEFNNIRLDRLAEDLLKPFGLRVFLSVTPQIVEKFSTKPGDTVFEALDRAARLQGFFWLGTRGGNIRLTRAARARSTSGISEDVNMQSGTLRLDDSMRFNQYQVKGQSRGTDNYPGTLAASAVGSSTDEGIGRYRPLTIIEGNVTNEIAKTRAEWEATTRIAKAVNLDVVVQGWQQEDGNLWGVNQLIRVESETLGISGDFLSTMVSRTRDNSGGTLSRIAMTRQDAYTPQPVIPSSSKATNSLEAYLGSGS